MRDGHHRRLSWPAVAGNFLLGAGLGAIAWLYNFPFLLNRAWPDVDKRGIIGWLLFGTPAAWLAGGGLGLAAAYAARRTRFASWLPYLAGTGWLLFLLTLAQLFG
jgi:hypothetical protein